MYVIVVWGKFMLFLEVIFVIYDGKMSLVFDLRKLDLLIYSNCRIRIFKGESE